MKKKGALKLAKDVTKAAKKGIGFPPLDVDTLQKFDIDLRSFGRIGKATRRFIRRHPVPAALLCLGVGYFVAAKKDDTDEVARAHPRRKAA